MKHLAILNTFLLISSVMIAQSQRVALDVIQGAANINSHGGMLIGKSLPQSDIEGSPYLFDDFLSGDLKLSNNKLIERIDLNFDLYNNVMIIRKENGELFSLASQYLSNFTVANSEYKFVNGLSIKSDLVEILFQNVENDFELWKRHELYKKDPTYMEGVDIGNRNYVLTKKNVILGMYGGNVSNLKTKKDLMALFDGNTDLKKFIREKKLMPKNEDELILNLKEYFETNKN